MTQRFTLALFAAPLLMAAAPSPDPALLKADVTKLVSFGTRHTLSSATDPKRGIGAGRAWVSDQFRALGLRVDLPAKHFTAARMPQGADIVDVLGIQPGTGDPNDVVIVAGHIDSRVSDVFDANHDAPGANDDGSGVAVVLAAARMLAHQPHRQTIIYAVLSGEEQGLFGGQLLAETAKARGWHVSAMLNNDIVGNTSDTTGRIVADRVRVFSEGIRASDDLAAQLHRRNDGGEDDGPSRALAKAVARIADQQHDIAPFLVRRPDRFSRGGDHLPMLDAGYPAVRFTSGIENYDAQHQDLRTENGRVFGDTIARMDFNYLARVAALNIAVLRELADAPPAPARVTISGAVSSDTLIKWTPVAGAAGYRIRWRRADAQNWQFSKDVTTADPVTLKGIVIDDIFFGVSALSANGAESVVSFAGAGR